MCKETLQLTIEQQPLPIERQNKHIKDQIENATMRQDQNQI